MGGFLILVLGLLWTKQSFCPPSENNARTVKGEKNTNQNQSHANEMQNMLVVEQKKPNNKNEEAATSNFENLPPSWLCEEVKFTDLLLAYFTYCLVIVGWFTIRSGERNSRNLERAYIFSGPWRPYQVGPSVITFVTIENFGRSPGILKEAYGEYSATEPVAKYPTYKNGSSRSFDSAIPPTPVRPPNFQPNTLPAKWESPLPGEQYFFGYVRYVDIFGVRHESRFCAKIFPGEHKSDIAGPPAWNDWN